MSNKTRNVFILLIIAIAAASRLLPHAPNFTPIAAIALFGGAMIANRLLSILLPIAALFISDLVLQYSSGLGFYDYQWTVYLAFIIIVFMGRQIGESGKAGPVIVGSLTASIVFFLITNLGSWLAIEYYSKDLFGLMQSYAAGLPFFKNTVAGDLFYSVLLFGTWALVTRTAPKLSAIRRRS